MPLFADPESRILTPMFLLQLVFGAIVGLHLEFTLHLVIAWLGGYVLGRVLGVGRLPSVVCASLFPASSWCFLHYGVGHAVFMAILYFPWILVFWLKSATEERVPPAIVAE